MASSPAAGAAAETGAATLEHRELCGLTMIKGGRGSKHRSRSLPSDRWTTRNRIRERSLPRGRLARMATRRPRAENRGRARRGGYHGHQGLLHIRSAYRPVRTRAVRTRLARPGRARMAEERRYYHRGTVPLPTFPLHQRVGSIAECPHGHRSIIRIPIRGYPH